MQAPQHSPQRTIVYRRQDSAKSPFSTMRTPTTTGKACTISTVCRTCQFIDEAYLTSFQNKYNNGIQLLEQAGLLKHAEVIPPTPSTRPLHYRAHAKLAVRPGSQSLESAEGSRFALGLFQPESHQLVNVATCPLHKETINRVMHDLRALLEASPFTPYDETTQSGDLRYVAIRAAHLTEELMITFVMTSDKWKNELRLMVNELRRLGHQINAAHLNINSDTTNVIFGSETKRIAGADRLRERLCDLDFEIGPTSFFQVNPWQAEIIYRRVEQLAGDRAKQDVAWDFYCGIGQISMLLARRGYRVLGVEANAQAIRDAQKNSMRNKLAQTPHFMTGKVEDLQNELPAWAKSPRLIVTNPARKGLAESVCQLLKTTMASQPNCQLIYVSCEISSLVRDLALIVDDKRKLRQIEAFDMFPHTEKMEWLAVIQ